MNIRAPAVAGRFYDNSPERLESQLSDWLSSPQDPMPVKALIVPHAGYVYSGKVAADAYQYLRPISDKFKKVILVGPSHRYGFDGVAIPAADFFATPLGNIEIDRELSYALSQNALVAVTDQVHAPEHSLEVQLPFLQASLDSFTLLPIVYSKVTSQVLAELIETVWRDDETLLVISSDLSHYHTYDEACEIDKDTCQRIANFDMTLEPHQACGATGINAVLNLARARGYSLTEIDYRNSGDTGGNKERVVGYVSYLISAV
ncbi:AmmeMemoRadiSam system protein B [Veronia nyctiphanis]|uniref:MEMO1 family protein CS022_05405 n=1 Tax=Veronia nyctiphanis TaxID=1278244 RepID=A0A4Q0YSF3_9GAMM|nr:AmmeMemoRadiSam system protein B [Veronia nyctiphanis]RXJ74076.1 AmmeMemoRadiSam system protein B [Veronia nyctiphanis]